MKLNIHPLRTLRENLRDIGTAVNASRQYTCARSGKMSAPSDASIPF